MLGTEVANGVKIPNGVKVANGVKVKLGEAVCTNVSRSYSMISDTEELVGAADAAKKRKKADWSQADVIRIRPESKAFELEVQTCGAQCLSCKHALSPERSSFRHGGHEPSIPRASRYGMSPERSSSRRSRNHDVSRGSRYVMSPERSTSVRPRDSSASLSRRFHRIIHAPSREFEGGPWDKRRSTNSVGLPRRDSVPRNEVTVYQPSNDLSYSPSNGSPRHHLAHSKPLALGPGYGVTEPGVGEQEFKLGRRHSVGRTSNLGAPYDRSPFS